MFRLRTEYFILGFKKRTNCKAADFQKVAVYISMGINKTPPCPSSSPLATSISTAGAATTLHPQDLTHGGDTKFPDKIMAGCCFFWCSKVALLVCTVCLLVLPLLLPPLPPPPTVVLLVPIFLMLLLLFFAFSTSPCPSMAAMQQSFWHL